MRVKDVLSISHDDTEELTKKQRFPYRAKKYVFLELFLIIIPSRKHFMQTGGAIPQFMQFMIAGKYALGFGRFS